MDQRTAWVACILTEKTTTKQQQQTIKVESTMNALLKLSCEAVFLNKLKICLFLNQNITSGYTLDAPLKGNSYEYMNHLAHTHNFPFV